MVNVIERIIQAYLNWLFSSPVIGVVSVCLAIVIAYVALNIIAAFFGSSRDEF